MNNKNSLVLSLLAIIITSSSLFAQIDYRMLTGADKNHLDTLSRELTKDAIKEASGLLEKEIDPNKYIVGQGDEFGISIMTAKPRHLELKVSPDGTLMIPTVGKVFLKGKILKAAVKEIEELINKVLTPNEVVVVLKDIRKFKVSVSGSVAKTGIMPATAADRVSEIIDKAGGLKFDASMRNIILLRDGINERIKIDLLKFYLIGDEESNPYLLGGDKIIVPPSKDAINIGIFGEVGSPGTFEFVEGDSLSTLVRFGLGFVATSFLDSVEFVRIEGKNIIKKSLDLSSWRNITSKYYHPENDFPLQVGDRLFVRKIANLGKQEYVVIKGEVTYPGYYAIEENQERLSELIKRVGGFTEDAAIQSIEYLRQNERDKPDEEMERLSRILPSEMSESETRYYQARKLEKRGIMSVDIRKVMSDVNSPDNIILVHRDSIVVPSIKNYINVQGRVVNPGLILYQPGLTYSDYINLAGGFGYRADEDETIINKTRGGLFRAKDMNYVIEPGDVILVPPEKELTFIEAFSTGLTIVTQILTIAGVVLAFTRF